MDAFPEPLSDREEFALKRRELFQAIRGEGLRWHWLSVLVPGLPISCWVFYSGYDTFANGHLNPGLILMCGATAMFSLTIALAAIMPMHTKMSAIAKLLEQEAKRSC